MKRISKIRLAMLLVVCILLTACGENKNKKQEDASTETEDSDAAITKDLVPVNNESGEENESTAFLKDVSDEKEVADILSEDEFATGIETVEETENGGDNVIDFDEEIKKHYISKKEYEMQIQILLLANLEQASYIEIPDDSSDINYRKMITDALVTDVLDDSILSEGAKSAIDAICEGKSTREIIDETTSGLLSGAEDYVISNITEILEGDSAPILHCQLFDEITWINEFLNVDDTPIGLLNGMISRQKSDIELLLGIISKDEIQTGDLSYVSGLYKRICERQNEIISAGGTSNKIGQQELLDKLIEQWKLENATIYALNILQNPEADAYESEENIYSTFRTYEMPALPSCYDVSAYREQQKYTEQSEMVSGEIFGDILGSMVSQDSENNQKTMQENRISFYTYLENSLENSYAIACAAKEVFDELYDAEYALCEIPLEEYHISGAEEIYPVLTHYLDAVAKYNFDLRVATLFWSNTLSENESEYIDNLNRQIQNNYSILNEGVNIGIVVTGYDPDEESARYMDLMNKYIDFLNYSMLYYSRYETTFSGVSNVTAYGVGNFDVYYRGKESIPVIFAEEQLDTNWHQQRYLWIYDVEGNPIYIRNQHGTVYAQNGVVIACLANGLQDDWETGYKLYNIAVRILQDFKSGTLRSSYKDYAI